MAGSEIRWKDVPNERFEFESDDFVVVDGATGGSGKMKASKLLELTAQNALAGNVAPAFDPTKPDDAGGYAYYKDEIVAYNGATYKFKVNHSSGAWNSSEVKPYNAGMVLPFFFSTDNPEYKLLVTDSDGYLLLGIKNDGNIEYGRSEQIANVILPALNEFADVAAPNFNPNRVETYKAGKCVIYNNKLMRFKVDHPTGPWIGTDAEEALLSSLCDFNYIQENPEYVYAMTDSDGYLLFGVKTDGEFVYGKSSQFENAVLSRVDKVKSSNILVHKIYNSSSISDELSIDNAVGEYIWTSVLVDDYYDPSYTYSIEIIDGSNAGVVYSSLGANRDIRKLNIGKGCTKIRFIFSNAAAVKVALNAWNYYDAVSATLKIDVAGGDPMAHFICDGANDEEEFSEAVAALCFSGVVEVGKGNYYFDDLPERFSGKYGAVLIGTAVTWYRKKLTIRGLIKGRDYVGTRIIVRDSAFDNVPEGVEASIFGSNEIKNAGVLKLYDLRVELESNNHKVVIVNGQYFGGLVVNNCAFTGGENEWSETPPPQGSVGVRGVMGDCNGTEYEIKDSVCVALYEGFQLGGEHLVMTECGTRFCYYGYSFGNYDYGSWYGDNPVTDSHPLTLINCCDEGSRRLPLFAKCGVHSESGAKALQPVDLISFNLEVHTASLVGAEEVTPGSFCGRIDFVAYGASNTSKSTSPEATRGNRVDVRFWKNGSGSNFRTTNATHKQRGTTAERLGYWAQYMQQYYDVTLNKMLVCVDEENQTWVDFNGTSV